MGTTGRWFIKMAGVENLPRFRFCLVSVQTPLVGEDGIWYSKIYGLLAMLDESLEKVWHVGCEG